MKHTRRKIAKVHIVAHCRVRKLLATQVSVTRFANMYSPSMRPPSRSFCNCGQPTAKNGSSSGMARLTNLELEYSDEDHQRVQKKRDEIYLM